MKLMELFAFPASYGDVSTALATQKLGLVMSSNAQVSVGNGVLYADLTAIYGKLIAPKIAIKNVNLLKPTIIQGKAEFDGRCVLLLLNKFPTLQKIMFTI